MTPRPCVLVVDDDPAMLDTARAVLAASGYEVLLAPDLDGMIDALSKRKPGAVLLDMMMPEILGSDLVGYVREVHGVRGPVVLFSSMAESRLAAYARSSGADGYITKDAGLRSLAERLPNFLPLTKAKD